MYRKTISTLFAAALLAITAAAPTARAADTKPAYQTAIFAGGCFWSIQKLFDHVAGVVSTTVGYTGGTRKNPSYEQVSDGNTGHLESVKVVYDPAQVSYADPFTPQLALDGHKLSAVEPTGDALAAADCVLILTSHTSFDYAEIASRASLVVDTRNAMKNFRGARASIVSL